MNCYYSNLIEGHDTHPIDIERALHEDYSADAKKRDLQLEAIAHITVQKWIDEGALKGIGFAVAAARKIHRRFCEHLPEGLLWVEDPAVGERFKVEPGEFRNRGVRVGSHVAISPGAIERFMQRFEKVFGGLACFPSAPPPDKREDAMKFTRARFLNLAWGAITQRFLLQKDADALVLR